MSNPTFPIHLEDKIFEIEYDSNIISKIISYFPFSIAEKQEINSVLSSDFNNFQSIFTDTISDEEWIKTKEQIKKKFNDELFEIDKNT
jgi:hypothetical protein